MRYASLLLMFGAVGFAGCVTPPAVTIAPTPTRSSETIATMVRPDQVTPETAHKMAQALADELDREAQHDIVSATMLKK
jgi:hypothetical protein